MTTLNNLTLHNQRSIEQWKRTWQDLKKKTKKKLTTLRIARNRTGGGEINDTLELTSDELRIVEICGLGNLDGHQAVMEIGIIIAPDVSQQLYSQQPLLPQISSIEPLPTPPSSTQPSNTFIQPMSTQPSSTQQSSTQPSITQASISQQTPPSHSTHRLPTETPLPQPQSTSLETPQIAPQASRSESAARARRRRARINQMLPPRGQRYRDNDQRSESITYVSVARQLQLQEETVNLLKDIKRLINEFVNQQTRQE